MDPENTDMADTGRDEPPKGAPDEPITALPISYPGVIPDAQRSNLKILSLDGGGIRGLSMILMLEAIFAQLNERRKHRGWQPIEPWQYFDLIGGTSTGGIIALMLGRLRMSIHDCKIHYINLGEEVFGTVRGIGHKYKFYATKLESVLKDVISAQLSHVDVSASSRVPERSDTLSRSDTPGRSDTLGRSDTPGRNGTSGRNGAPGRSDTPSCSDTPGRKAVLGRKGMLGRNGVPGRNGMLEHSKVPGRSDAPLLAPLNKHCSKVIVFTVSREQANPPRPDGLRTYDLSRYHKPDFTIWEAARATSAAPRCFKPLLNAGSEWVDGAINKRNNPAREILREASDIWKEEGQTWDERRIGFFLSLGTGVPGTNTLSGGVLDEITSRFGLPEATIRAICENAVDTEEAHGQVSEIFDRTFQDSMGDYPYYRFNVPNLRTIDFFEYKEMPTIRQLTYAYIESDGMRTQLNNCLGRAMESTRDPNQVAAPQSFSDYNLAALINFLRTKVDLLRHVPDFDQEKYFWRLTVKGLDIYDAIYTLLPKDADGYVSCKGFASALSKYGPPKNRIVQRWTRMSCGEDALMPRNLILCVLYMIHVDCYYPRQEGERSIGVRTDPLTEREFRSAQLFGTWIDCHFHGENNDTRCGRRWNYANNKWGLCRGANTDVEDTDVECQLWLWYSERTTARYSDKFLREKHFEGTMHRAARRKAKGFRNACWREFYEQPRENWRLPNPALGSQCSQVSPLTRPL